MTFRDITTHASPKGWKVFQHECGAIKIYDPAGNLVNCSTDTAELIESLVCCHKHIHDLGNGVTHFDSTPPIACDRTAKTSGKDKFSIDVRELARNLKEIQGALDRIHMI